uniref:Tubulin-tyrosine ligase family, putative n=1 Tax=Theileria annulata TaxID=5874 RepID=A0A3B0MKR0_THEAN
MNFFHDSGDLKSGKNVRNNLQPSYTSSGFFQEDGFINFKTKLTDLTDDIPRDSALRAESLEFEPTSFESQNDDSEALNCIKEILDLLYKVCEGQNDKIDPLKNSNKLGESVKLGHFRECCRNKNENDLNKLLSLRLNQISKLKEHCINGDFELSRKTYTQRTPEVKSLNGRGYLRKPVINVSESRSDFWLLTFCSKSLRWKSSNDNIGDIYWLGYSVTSKQLGEIISNNKRISNSKIAVNRFPGIQEITKKGNFYHLLEVYSTHKLLNITQNTTTDTANSFNNANYLADDTNVRYWPRSFMLPDNLNKVLKLVEKNVPLIFKPSNGSMGQGVRVVTVPEDINEEMLVDYTAQEYVSIPLLIKGKKFDIRLYLLLIASKCNNNNSPGIKGFIFKNSLVRFCTENYEYPSVNNINNSFMHLTNYNINKANVTKYHRGDPDDQNNSKRPLKPFLKTLELEGYNTENIWSQIIKIGSITIQTIYPDIYLNTRISRVDNFQIFGLDVMIDVYGRVWLLEVNCCPSLKTSYFDGKEFRDDAVDLMIKVPLITEALKIVNITLNGYSGHDNNFYSKFEDWDEISISEFKPELTLIMELFKRAKGEFLEKKYITKREWNQFCKLSGITEIITVTTINSQKTNGNIDSNDNFEDMVKKSKIEGKKILNKMFGEVVKDSQGVCFADFAVLLGRCCKIIEKWIKISDSETISTICKRNNFLNPLEIFRWSISKPHNSINHPENYVFSKFLRFLNDTLSLSHSKLV